MTQTKSAAQTEHLATSSPGNSLQDNPLQDIALQANALSDQSLREDSANESATRPAAATLQCAVVVGVGASQGIGAAVCRRIAREGLLVYVAGRSVEKLDKVVAEIRQQGGAAERYVLDASKTAEVDALFRQIAKRQQVLALVVHNVGSNMPSRFLSSSLHFFDRMWRLTFVSGYLVGQRATRLMLKQQHGTLIFTGASASLRGKPYFAAFTSGKSALRAYAQGLAKRLDAENIHVAHVVIDGVVDGDRVNKALYGLGDWFRRLWGKGGLSIESIADNYWMLHQQAKPVWIHELDLRPLGERF